MAELVIVVLIMGVFAAVATPTFVDSLLFHRVEGAARRVKADLELTRQTARLTSAAKSITFTNSSYTISSLKSLGNPNKAYAVNLAAPPYSLESATANFAGTQSVSFDGYGTPSSAGTVVVTAKTHQCTVTLNGTTGDVTITSNHTGGGAAEAVGG